MSMTDTTPTGPFADYEQATTYIYNCFISSEQTYAEFQSGVEGPEAIYTGTPESPRIQLCRTDLPGGPLGDEMWYRLTVGLERLTIQW